MSQPHPPMLNLVPLERLEQRRRRARVLAWAGAATAYALLIAVAAMVVHGPAARSLQDVRRAARLATEEAEAAVDKRAQTLRTVATKMRVLEASQTVGQHPDWSVLLGAIAGVRGDGIVITVLELTEDEQTAQRPDAGGGARAAAPTAGPSGAARPGAPGPKRTDSFHLRIVGMGLSHSEVMGFVARLEDMGPLRNVAVIDARSGRVGDAELTNFEIRCRIADSAETGGER